MGTLSVRELVLELFRRRQDLGVSASEVARRAGLRRWTTVREIEQGRTDPRIATLQGYARAVGCQLRMELEPDSSIDDQGRSE